MNINKFIDEWLAASNAHDTENYLKKWQDNAVLDDPSAGKIFNGHPGIKEYFEEYFIGYNTQSQLIKTEIVSETEARIELMFTGNFPGNKINGTFDLAFKNGKIAKAKAQLI